MASLLRTVCGRAAWVGALWLVVSAGSALAEEPKSTKSAETKPAEGNPWSLNCASGSAGTELQCQVSQNLTEAKTGQRVLTVTVRRDNGNGNLAMLLALPHGLFLPSGASYQIDQGQKTTIAIQTSDQNGAYAATPLSADLLKAVKSGTNLNIGIESVTRKPVTIPVSLAGFTAAIDKLQALK
ncbi:invasion associated locus B family protein [Mesorhizobium sp. RSR380A]|uniref:invasion associated locus B family protein n=1 Tax=Mesorhizobium sp. LNJC380A00 TaxID=1287264 RepID=UPI0003CDFA4F|nr:invasion associated locus B family protein [Mesorhizobium sp. LNJC380A00]ESY48494.1 invasion associated locus B family protein [Mesorhizobium sp. LNJC380A00]